MPGSKTDYSENKMLDHRYGGPDYVRPATVYIGLFIIAPTDAGGGTECSAGNYARKAVTNNATNFPAASGSKSLAVQQDLVQANADWAPTSTPAVAFGFFDAATAGNLLDWGWLGSDAGKIFVAATSDTLTAPGHTLVNNDQVRAMPIPGATLPTGLSAGTTYFVIGASGDTLQLSTTLGGATIDITASGGGLIAKIQAKPVLSGDTASFAASSLTITED